MKRKSDNGFVIKIETKKMLSRKTFIQIPNAIHGRNIIHWFVEFIPSTYFISLPNFKEFCFFLFLQNIYASVVAFCMVMVFSNRIEKKTST